MNGSRRAGQLTPEMASFRLLVLNFVRDYFAQHGGSPSYGEVAAGLHSNHKRVRKAIQRLARDGALIKVPGPRGLALPDRRAEAIRLLREQGFVVDEDILAVEGGVRDWTLLPPPELDYSGPLPDAPPGGEPDGADIGSDREHQDDSKAA
jgi:hypothetical protein